MKRNGLHQRDRISRRLRRIDAYLWAVVFVWLIFEASVIFWGQA